MFVCVYVTVTGKNIAINIYKSVSYQYFPFGFSIESVVVFFSTFRHVIMNF